MAISITKPSVGSTTGWGDVLNTALDTIVAEVNLTGWVLAGTPHLRGQKPILPTSGRALFGAYVSLAAQGTEAASLTYRETALGRKLDIANHFYNWQDPTLLTLVLPKADIAAGRIPMLSWQGTTLSDINNGTSDTWIAQVAQAMAAARFPIILRWGWEMNGNWYAWSGPSNGSDPTAWISAYQRIWRIFQQQGATNVGFLFSPNSSSTPGGTTTTDANNWRNYYPGDAYVDYVGASIYNAVDLTNVTWNGVRTYADAIITDWKANFGGLGGASKPFIVAEWGCYTGPGGNKPQWLTDASGYWKMQGVSAVCYFDTNNSSSSIPWAADSTANSLTAYKGIASDPYFGGSGVGGSGHRAKVLALAPFAYWRLDALTGTYPDLGSGNNAGTVNGNVQRGAVSHASGLGGAASTQSGAYISCGTMGTLGSSLSSGFTVELLYKHGANSSSATPQGAILATLNTGVSTVLAIYTNTDKNLTNVAGRTTFYYRNEVSAGAGTDRSLDLTTAAIYDGLWHHIVWVCNPAAVADTVYVDGSAVTPNSTSNATNIGASTNFGFPLTLLARNNRGTIDQQPIAALDEVAIYQTKLSSGQVSALYASLTA